MTTRRTVLAYVVQELGWVYNDEYDSRRQEHDMPVKAFLDRAAAEAYLRELEAARPVGVFDMTYKMGGWDWADKTSLSEPQMRARLAELGLHPPANTSPEELLDWMYEQWPRLTDEQARGVWAALDRVRRYQVVPTAVELHEG